MAAAATPSSTTLLEVLSRPRLVAVSRRLGVAVPATEPRDKQIALLLGDHDVRFERLLALLGRDELKAACRAHALDDSGRARTILAERLLRAHGGEDAATAAPAPIFTAGGAARRDTPSAGDMVSVRHRQYLVEDVTPPPQPEHATLVRLVCLDDDNQGRRLDVLWELELGARILQPETHGLGTDRPLDPPRYFAAYLHALKWSAVTATDARLFQAPFRAGIRLMNHQLTPLKKALELPRANLFIADDVGLGKTIEAGLVLQELQLRQRVDYTLIICPAAVSLQWRDEMDRRFGLHFEIMNRAFVGRRRQERGFAVNPWATHTRFIISFQTVRRPEYRDPLLQHLGKRALKSLLIVDEAHTAAPATATKYAVDSRTTKVIRDVAPRFENRLFLSATPHNGHSNSFSALLEILDPQRFTRGVAITSTAQLEPVMVRRLKSDLRALGTDQFPDRKVVQIDLTHADGAWTAAIDAADPRPLGAGDAAELELTALLARYASLVRPTRGRGKLVFINLQKRLLSSFEAFYRTLSVHARAVDLDLATTPQPALPLPEPERADADANTDTDANAEADDDEYGLDDDALEAAAAAAVAAATRHLATPDAKAKALLTAMVKLAEQHRGAPDAKVSALVDWMQRNQCPAVAIGGATKSAAANARAWTDRRVIIFTEYGDTLRYLRAQLTAAIAGTADADARIMQFHGGMSDEQRDEVQQAFNSQPDDHPVRILIATDAAREGVNLQGHCADLFHFDIPWNPARMEQRNGRIDRTLQAAREVRCHYFIYPQRGEDLVLRKVVAKVDTIVRELGSLSSVILDRFEQVLGRGIDSATDADLDAAEEASAIRQTVGRELESQRPAVARLRAEIDEAGKILNASRSVMEFDPVLLKDAIDVGLELAGAPPLTPVAAATAATAHDADTAAYRVPDLPDSWLPTLDRLRPPRGRNEPLWEWRKKPPQPVVFKSPPRMNSALVHLHLQHPFVRRILSRFLAQGYSGHDLSRVTVVPNPDDTIVRVIAFGRLSLFGPGATRLHDQLVSVAAQWLETGGKGHLKPFADRADRRALDSLEKLLTRSPTLDGIGPKVRARLQATAAHDFATLWPHVRDEADHFAHEASALLATRATHEADAMKQILNAQREAITTTIASRRQTAFDFTPAERAQREQFEQDEKHMQGRLADNAEELASEPAKIAELYEVKVHRLEPVGLVYLWPETRG